MENLELETTEAEPTLDGTDKCEHDVYKAGAAGFYDDDGNHKARYCTGCNPASARIIAPRKHIPEVKHVERVMDAAEFLDMPVGARLAAAGAWINDAL